MPMAPSSASASAAIPQGSPPQLAMPHRSSEFPEVAAPARDAAEVAVAACAAAMPTPLAASSPSVEGAAGSEEKWPSLAEGGSLRPIGFVLTVVVALAVSILFLVRFHGHPMSQVWILSISICLNTFIILRICRTRWFYIDLFRLSYGPLLALFSANHIGSITATFVLLFSTVWAAGNLGYSLAVHRLRKGAEPAIRALPSPSLSTKGNFDPYVGAPFVLLWTLITVLIVNISTLTDELDILTFLSYMGWIHVAVWLVCVALMPMTEFPLGEQIQLLAPALILWMVFSPVICIVSQILSALCHLLLMMALVAFLWYNLAIYIHFLETAVPSASEAAATLVNGATLHSEILEDKIGHVKSDPRFGTTPNEAASTTPSEAAVIGQAKLDHRLATLHFEILEEKIALEEIALEKMISLMKSDLVLSSEAAATLGNEDTLHSKILEGKLGQVKSGPRLGTSSSEAAATLGNEDTLHSKILEDKIGQVKSDPILGTMPTEAASILGNEDTLSSNILEEKIGQVKFDETMPSELIYLSLPSTSKATFTVYEVLHNLILEFAVIRGQTSKGKEVTKLGFKGSVPLHLLKEHLQREKISENKIQENKMKSDPRLGGMHQREKISDKKIQENKMKSDPRLGLVKSDPRLGTSSQRKLLAMILSTNLIKENMIAQKKSDHPLTEQHKIKILEMVLLKKVSTKDMICLLDPTVGTASTQANQLRILENILVSKITPKDIIDLLDSDPRCEVHPIEWSNMLEDDDWRHRISRIEAPPTPLLSC